MNIAEYKKELENRRDFSIRFNDIEYELRFFALSSGKPCLGFGSPGREWVFLPLEKGWVEKLALITYRDRTIQEILEKGERL